MSTVTKETVLACVNDTHARTHTSSVVTPAPSAILRVEIDPSAHTHTHTRTSAATTTTTVTTTHRYTTNHSASSPPPMRARIASTTTHLASLRGGVPGREGAPKTLADRCDATNVSTPHVRCPTDHTRPPRRRRRPPPIVAAAAAHDDDDDGGRRRG